MSNIDEIYYIEKNSFAEPWTREMLEGELNSALSVLTTEKRGGKIAAYALGRVVANEAELFKIAVLPEFRRQGIAQALLLALHEKMRQRGAEVCFLEVRSRNLPAILLYEKLGYAPLRVIPRYYPDDDALVMRCVLKDTPGSTTYQL